MALVRTTILISVVLVMYAAMIKIMHECRPTWTTSVFILLAYHRHYHHRCHHHHHQTRRSHCVDFQQHIHWHRQQEHCQQDCRHVPTKSNVNSITSTTLRLHHLRMSTAIPLAIPTHAATSSSSSSTSSSSSSPTSSSSSLSVVPFGSS